jgi:nucleoside-diphosphate-sugar epimerase
LSAPTWRVSLWSKATRCWRSSGRVLSDLRIKPILGSLTDHGSLERAVRDLDLLFHVAADYRFWVPDPHMMHEVNVIGTERLMELAWKAGVGRMVYTSSTVTVRCSPDRLGTEDDFLLPNEARSTYQRTKILAEQAVWRLIGRGAPITIVNPSTPAGSLHFWKRFSILSMSVMWRRDTGWPLRRGGQENDTSWEARTCR